MDKVYLNQMAFYGYHGVFPEENKLGQRFLVDLTLEGDLKPASRSDDIHQTVDYGKAYELVRKVVEGEKKKLVETVTEQIAAEVFLEFPVIERCTVKVIKPDPPIPGHYDSVAVEMTRERQ
ncbi:MAG TPA: dihydroneopterin aldolase [Bacillales bacterium]|nr:dihydroneopterin aldolase [Bacillales bacterium]HEU5141289.1 dihydroneopterin aldolase [Bacillales bacterium]